MTTTPENEQQHHALFVYTDELHFAAMVNRMLRHAADAQVNVRFFLPTPLSQILVQQAQVLGMPDEQCAPLGDVQQTPPQMHWHVLQAQQEARSTAHIQGLWLIHDLSCLLDQPSLLAETEKTLSHLVQQGGLTLFCVSGPLQSLSEKELIWLFENHPYYYQGGSFQPLPHDNHPHS